MTRLNPGPDPIPGPIPGRPRLRGGLRLVRRDPDHVQVGIDPPHRVILRDDPEVHRLVHDLAAGRLPRRLGPTGHRALLMLAAAGMLVEDLAEQPTTTVLLDGAEGPGTAEVRRLLETAGLRTVSDPRRAGVVVAVSVGELPRDRADEWLRDDVPHLPVTLGSQLRVGPFVVPGLTACLRCVDAHLGELDPRRGLVLEQATASPELSPARYDVASRHLAWSWVVRDLLSFVEGTRPATWSASVVIDPALRLVRTEWLRHPRCGCSWDAARAG